MILPNFFYIVRAEIHFAIKQLHCNAGESKTWFIYLKLNSSLVKTISFSRMPFGWVEYFMNERSPSHGLNDSLFILRSGGFTSYIHIFKGCSSCITQHIVQYTVCKVLLILRSCATTIRVKINKKHNDLNVYKTKRSMLARSQCLLSPKKSTFLQSFNGRFIRNYNE